jgi:hypothetical protein
MFRICGACSKAPKRTGQQKHGIGTINFSVPDIARVIVTGEHPMSETVQISHGRPLIKTYLVVSAIIAASIALLVVATGEPPVPADARELVRPMSVMFALTAAVWLLMGLYRNGAVMRRLRPSLHKRAMLKKRNSRNADSSLRRHPPAAGRASGSDP